MIKKLVVFYALSAHLINVSSQSSSKIIDSLLLRLDKAKIEEKAYFLNQLAQNYVSDDPGKGVLYAEKALDLSLRQKNTEQEALAYQNLGVSNYKLYKFDEALNNYAKAKGIFQRNGKTSQIAGVNVRIGLVQSEKNSYADAQKSFFEALEIYKTLNDKPGISNSLNAMGSLALKQMNLELALDYYNQSLIIRKSLNSQGEIAASYSNVALVYRKMTRWDSALHIYQQALDIRQKINNPGPIATTLNDIGNVYWDNQNWEKAIEYYFKSIKIRYETGNKIEIANSYQNIGLLYSNLGNSDKAKEYYQLALSIYKENDDMRKLATTLVSLGNIEKDSKNFEEALTDYKRALTYRKSIGEKKDIAASLNNLGIIYGELKQNSQAIHSFNEAFIIRKDIGDVNGQISTLNDMGNFYESVNNAEKAQTSFELAYQLAQQTNNTFYIGLCARKLAEGLINHNQIARAFNLLTVANDAGAKLNNAELRKRAHYVFFQYYKKTGNYEKALENFEKYTEINENQQNAQNTLKMLSINQNLELEKKNNEIRAIESEVQLLRQKDEIQSLALTKQKYFTISLLVVIVFAIISGFLFYNHYKTRKKHSLMLEQQYALIEEANDRLKKSEANLTMLNATKDRYFSVIAHDIKNPLSSLLNLSQIIIEKFDTLKDNEIQEFQNMIHESASNLYNLLENLLNWARNNTNRIRFNPLPMKLLPVVNNVLLLNKLTAIHKNIEVKCNISDNIEVFADLQMLTSIMRNLVSNAIKFTPDGGNIIILAREKYNTVEISVTDTGLGITAENLQKIFRLDTHFTTPGTGNEAGTGLGLILVKEFVEKNKGKISFSSEPGKGSTFTFTLPNGK